MDKAMHDKGMSVRRKVLGDAYVDAATKNVDDFNRPLQDFRQRILLGCDLGPRRAAAQDPQHAQPRHDQHPQPAA